MPFVMGSLLGGLELRGAQKALVSGAHKLGAAMASAGKEAVHHALAGNPVETQTYDQNKLARRLGTPVPSPSQINTEKKRIDDENRISRAKHGASGAIKNVLGFAPPMAKMAAGIGLATVAAVKLANALNRAAVHDLKDFNVAIAAFSANETLRGIRGKVSRAKMVQGTTISLGESLAKMRAHTRPYKALAENATNFALEKLSNLINGGFNMVKSLGIEDAARAINRWFGSDDKPKDNVLMKYINDTLTGTPRHPDENRFPRSRRPADHHHRTH